MRHATRAVLIGFIPAAIAGLSGCGFIGDSTSGKAVGADPVPPTATTRAVCGPGSREETALQGQVPQEDRTSGRSLEGYTCNLELVGKSQHGEGASWQFAWYDTCGYYGTLWEETREQPGTVVVQVADPAHPVETAVLQTNAMMDPHESLKVNEKRALLGAVELSGGGWRTEGDDYFDVYDVKGDCAHPKLRASVPIAGTKGHEGNWAPDGEIYWGSDITGGQEPGTYNAIDVTDPTKPQLIVGYSPQPTGGIHGLSISEDGTRGYFTTLEPAGFVIADVSAVKPGAANPRVTEISRIHWGDGALSQNTIPVTIGGKPYIIAVDEGGHGAARIIDISNEAVPLVVSKMKLDVHLPENCAAVNPEGGCGSIFVYDGHYCWVDRFVETTAVACGYFESGIRVFDVRDPVNPKEIAYYNPPAITDKPLPGSSHGGGTADHCASQVRFVKTADGGGQLWTQCQDNEFMVLKFTNGAWPFEEKS